MNQATPLCVDLDNTFIKTDLLPEQIFYLIKNKPLKSLSLIFWLYKGKAFLKQKLSEEVELELSNIPVNKDLVEFINNEKSKNRKIYLVTGSHQKVADGFRKLYYFFDEAFGSGNGVNLTSETKAKFLVSKFGKYNFDYVGDSNKDRPVWKMSRYAYLVGNPNEFNSEIKFEKCFPLKKNSLSSIFKLIRIHQWSKSIIMFAPFALSHRFGELEKLANSTVGFVSFCFIASSVYIMNDLLDVMVDRRHPIKRFRPLASGTVSILFALFLFIILFLSSISIAYTLNIKFLSIILFYFILNIIYSTYLKKLPVIDVFTLTSFYSLRLLAGGVAAGLEISSWLNSFSFFIFLSLAYLKRYSEILINYHDSGTTDKMGRDFGTSDISQLFTFGTTSGYMSVLVFSLYIYEEKTKSLYAKPSVLWLASIVMLYWINSIWLKASRRKIKEDPVKYALTDKESIIVGIIILIILIFAYLNPTMI